MKILILGSTGMAGHTVTLYLQKMGHDVTAFSNTPFALCKKNIVGDALDTAFFRNMITAGNYDVIINCIGILNKAAEDNQSLAVQLNSLLPHLVADCLKNTKTRLIHMSTDCVFSGQTGGYKEHSLRDGETFYDRSKALGEIDDEKNLTFRESIVGPDMNENGIGLFNWFMKQSGTIKGFTKAIWTGVTTLTLAKAMDAAINEPISGIYNLVNNQTICKYDLLGLFNKYFKDGSICIEKVDDGCLNKSLINTREDFGFKVPDYEQMVCEMKDWVCENRVHYPHYTL